jgi:hypothetical protein
MSLKACVCERLPSKHQDSRWHHLRPLLQGTSCCKTQQLQRTVHLSWFAFKHFRRFIQAEKFRMPQTSRTQTSGTPCLPHATRSTDPRADSRHTLVNDGLHVRLVTVISRLAIPLWIPVLRQEERKEEPTLWNVYTYPLRGVAQQQSINDACIAARPCRHCRSSKSRGRIAQRRPEISPARNHRQWAFETDLESHRRRG